MLRPLVEAVRSGRVSSRQLVTAAADRIAAADPTLNAVVGIDVATALEAADRLDLIPPEEQASLPLLGLPLLVKDIENAAGWRTTFGSVPYRDSAPATTDSVVVARLRTAGAVVLGRTNTCEFAFEGYTTNRLYGSTRNPWNPAWSPGGSSGGSAAALAAGLTPLATATDGGGSARIPAALCGLLGLKPTRGVIGSNPAPAWLDFHTDAVLATSAADLSLLLDVIAGGVAGDDAPGPLALHRPQPVHRILVVPRLTGIGPLPEPLADHLHEWSERLGAAFAVAVEHTTTGALFAASPDLPRRWDDDWYAATSAEQAHLLGAETIERHSGSWDPLFEAAMELGLALGLEQYLAIRRRNIEARRVLDRSLTPGTLLVTPVLTGLGYTPEGCAEGSMTPGSPMGYAQTVLANLTGHPAISLPAGLIGPGLPCGLQVMAGRWHDRSLLELAHRWERQRPWSNAPGRVPFDLASLGG